MNKNSKKLRVTLDLTPKADTKAGVIRQSLQLHEYLLDEAIGEKKIFIGGDKESAGEVVLFRV